MKNFSPNVPSRKPQDNLLQKIQKILRVFLHLCLERFVEEQA